MQDLKDPEIGKRRERLPRPEGKFASLADLFVELRDTHEGAGDVSKDGGCGSWVTIAHGLLWTTTINIQ